MAAAVFMPQTLLRSERRALTRAGPFSMTGRPTRSRAPVYSRHSGARACMMFEVFKLVENGGFGRAQNRQQAADEDDPSGEITPH